MGIYGNISQITAVYDEYINSEYDLGSEHEAVLETVEWLKQHDLRFGASFSDYAHQPCKGLVQEVNFMVNVTSLLIAILV